MTGNQRMDHFTVVSDGLAKTQAFYELPGLQPPLTNSDSSKRHE